MWLERLLRRLQSHPGPVLIEGGEAYGAPFLIDALGRARKVAWLQLSPAEASDHVAIGNRLADAVNHALGANYLPHALPFAYSLDVLEKQLPHLAPLTVACSNVDYAPLLRDSLLGLAAAGTHVVLAANGAAPAFRAGLHLRQEELALTPDEAEAAAGPHLDSGEKTVLWRASGGAYLSFMASVCRLRGLPLPHVPSPQGSLAVPGHETLVSPTVMLDVLRKLGRHAEALELAVMSAPERVAELISEAGPHFRDRGLLPRLLLLLDSLDERYQLDEKVLEWRLVAAYDGSDHLRLLPVVEAYLRDHEAPELRARYAGVLPDVAESFAQAQRAAAAKLTPFTLCQVGLLHPDNEEGAKLVRRSIKLAETNGRTFDVIRGARCLADLLNGLGRYDEASNWSGWALKRFDQAGLLDGSARLHLLHVHATARTLTGDTSGLRTALREAKDASSSAGLDVVHDLRRALAHLELVLGNTAAAEALAVECFEQSPRPRLSDAATTLVRVLLEQGKTDEALARAQYAATLTEGDDRFFSLPATLALGMAYAFIKPESAPQHLDKVLAATELEAGFRIAAALHLLKAGARRFEELTPDMQALLRGLSPSALRLFSGPASEFVRVWDTFAARRAPLQIRVLGQHEVWLDDKRLDLSERSLDVVVLLALHPEGLTSEALHDRLYEDGTSLSAVRTAVSRVRTLIPISGQPDAHRLMVPFRLDASECVAAIAAGDLKAALNLYRGSLLEKSEAPGVREARLYLEERLRQSVLHSGDADTLLALAETLRNDLELWEALHAALPLGDRRLPSVRAQLRRVERETHPTYN